MLEEDAEVRLLKFLYVCFVRAEADGVPEGLGERAEADGVPEGLGERVDTEVKLARLGGWEDVTLGVQVLGAIRNLCISR